MPELEPETAARRSRVLLKTLRTRIARAERELGKSDDPEAVAKLAELLELEARVRASSRKASSKAWALAVLGTILTVALLQLKRCSETEIDALMTLTAVDFETAGVGELRMPSEPSSVTASGLRHLDMPSPTGAVTPFDESKEESVQMMLTPEEGGRVTLASLNLTAGTRLRLGFTSPGSVSLRSVGRSTELQASLLGKVDVRPPVADAEQPFDAAGAVVATSSDDYRVTVAADEWEKCTICSPVNISSVYFSREERVDSLEPFRELPTIEGGEINFTGIGTSYRLRRGEKLRLKFTKMRVNELSALSTEPATQTFSLAIHGWVDAIDVGSEDNAIDLRPTWLEWLRTRHGPELVWASSVWIFAAAALVRQWLQREKASE